MDRPMKGWIYHFLEVMRNQKERGNEKAKDLKVRLDYNYGIKTVSFYSTSDKYSDVTTFTCPKQATNYLSS